MYIANQFSGWRPSLYSFKIYSSSQEIFCCSETLLCINMFITSRHFTKEYVWTWRAVQCFVTCSGLDGQVLIPGKSKIFFYSTVPIPALGPTQPPIKLIEGNLSLWVRRPRYEAHHSPPFNVEARNIGAIPPFPTCFHCTAQLHIIIISLWWQVSWAHD